MCEVALAWSQVPTFGVQFICPCLAAEYWLGCVWPDVWIIGVRRILGLGPELSCRLGMPA